MLDQLASFKHLQRARQHQDQGLWWLPTPGHLERSLTAGGRPCTSTCFCHSGPRKYCRSRSKSGALNRGRRWGASDATSARRYGAGCHEEEVWRSMAPCQQAQWLRERLTGDMVEQVTWLLVWVYPYGAPCEVNHKLH